MQTTTVRLAVSAQIGNATQLSGRADCVVVPDLTAASAYPVVVLRVAEAEQLVRALATIPVLVLWGRLGEALPDTLRMHPHVVAVLDDQSSADTVEIALRAARSLAQAKGGDARAAQQLHHVLEVGRALASEKDLDTLLALILEHARALTHADGASIYTRERDGILYFRLWQNFSVPNTAGSERHPVGDQSIAGFVARGGQPLMLEDSYAVPATAPYHFNPSFDQANGYRTRSLLTVPLFSKANDVVGVLQLVNRKDSDTQMLRNEDDVGRHVRAFDTQDREIALALAGQAGVALENSMLHADIERLFEGFIRASVSAIEARDPSTAGHSFRVAEFTDRLARAVDRSDTTEFRERRFSREELREIRYAALLHDFGKVGVREDVLVKAKKLHPHQLDQLKLRFKYARLSIAWQAHRGLFDLFESRQLAPDAFRVRRRELELEIAAEHQRLDGYLHTILRANEPTVLHANAPAALQEIMGYSFPGDAGATPLLYDFEFNGLSLPKGSLSQQERVEIESHVTHTFSFLSLIPWTRDLANLPGFAYAHHEKLDGSGYPRGLQQQDIPIQARMMTISDIYDALTAPDRPYKLAVPVERALAILESEAKAHKLDPALLSVFIESESWRLAT